MSEFKMSNKRIVSATFRIFEKSVNDMLFVLSNDVNESTYGISRDIDEDTVRVLKEKLVNLKKLINDFAADNSLEKETTNLSRIFYSKRTLWEIHLGEILSVNLKKRYGITEYEFKEYDETINSIISYIKLI
jgi:hypothetical protein